MGIVWGQDGKEVGTLWRHAGGIATAAFSPDNTYVVTGAGNDGGAVLWTRTGTRVAELHPGEGVRSVAFSPDGTRIVTAGFDHTARVWDLKGNEIAVLAGHEGMVTDVLFLPGGKRVVTASEDGTARIWIVDDQELMAEATRRMTRSFTPLEKKRYAGLLGE